MRRFAAPWLVLVCAACGADALEERAETWLEPVAIVLSDEFVDFTAIGATRRLSAVAVASSGRPIPGAPIAWSSTDPGVASVDADGLVTALSPGRADIVASYSGVASRAQVRVSPMPPDLARLAILPREPILTFLGHALELRALALDEEENVLAEVLATWEVENPSVATIDRLGILVAQAPGTTRVRATVLDGSLSTETTVTVRPLPSALVFLTRPADVVAGKAQSIRVEARDAGGQLVGTSDLVVELSAAYEDGRELRVGHRFLVQGIATFEDVVLERAGEVHLVARHGGVEGRSEPFRVHPGPPVGLGFVEPPGRVEVRVPFELRVAIADEFGNPVPSERAVIHLALRESSPAGLSLAGEASRETIDGIAIFSDLVLDGVGDAVLEAEAEDGPWDAAEIRLRTRYGFARLSAGGEHTCGLLRSGEALCFGANDAGQLGLPLGEAGATTPVPVPGLPLLRELAAAARHTCGISVGDEVICWGQVPGIASPPAAPLALALPAGAAPRSLGLGADHLCVAFDDGRVHCLGANDFGQLGDGGIAARSDLGPVAAAARFVAVAAGAGFSCAVAEDGFPWCWGRNDRGQLGGASSAAYEPAPVRLDSIRVVSLALGAAHACGLTREGRVVCWGDGKFGQVGDDGYPDAAAPRGVDLGGEVVEIAAGERHVCALRKDGQVFCWGAGGDGRLGAPHGNAPSALPLRVEPPFAGARFVHVAAGGAHGCAVEATGPTYCWGRGEEGQLGDGETASRAVPTPVAGTADE